MQGSDSAAAIIAASQKVIDETQRRFREADDAIRAMGFDPAKVKAALESAMGAKEKEEAARLIAQDLAEVQREVDEAQARKNFGETSSKGGKKPRSMV